MTGSASFIELLKSHLKLEGRQIMIRSWSYDHLGRSDRVYVNFINLPEGIGSAGGGAEAENNRISFWIEGFGKPNGKVKVEQHNSVLPRAYRLRAKTAAPEKIAQYLADFLNKIVQEVPPNFTHTKMP